MLRNIVKIIGLLQIFAILLNAQFGIPEGTVKTTVYKSFDKFYVGSEFKIAIKAEIADSWHINSNNPNDDFLIPTELSLISGENLSIIETYYPEAEEVNFSFTNKPVSVYQGEVFFAVKVKLPEDLEVGEYKIVLKLSYQACNNESCLPPMEVQDEIIIEVADKRTPVNALNSEIFSEIKFTNELEQVTNEGSIADKLESSGILLSIILVFIGGLALNLTPCVYPLIPITIGYFGGQSEGRFGRLFLLGSLYVLGMALTYSTIGVVTAISGAMFGALLQNPIVIIIIALILFTLSLSMFGLYEFKLPDSLVAKAGSAKTGYFGAFFMGLTLGIVAAPCIGPFVLGLLTYVASKGEIFTGFILFFFLAIGLGLPYLVLALFSGRIKSLPKAGFWMEAVKHIFGFLLLGMAIYFLLPILPDTISNIIMPIFLLIAAFYLLFIDRKGNEILGFRIFKIVFSVLIFTIGVYLLIPAESKSPDWQNYSDKLYNNALSNNENIIIDFYADWCIPCKELDAITFSDERIIELSEEFTAIKIDMTKTMSDETEELRKKFDIIGMPTIILINSKGQEARRITGFLGADEFYNILKGIN
ncbi:protein-disulfide reductase DsbD [Bacteroidota bacterium]